MALLEFVAAGDVAGVVSELRGLTSVQRKEFDLALTVRRDALELKYVYGQPTDRLDAQLAAELGCLEGAEAAAEWIRALEQKRRLMDMTDGGAWLLDVVDLRPVEWRVELVGLLSGYEATWRTFGFGLLEHLVHDTGCPVPTSDTFLTAWLKDRRYEKKFREAYLKGGARGADFRERLLTDPWTAQLLPLALTRPDVDLPLMELAKAGAAEPGLMDRVVVARRCFALLPDTGSWLWNLLNSVQLTPDEDARIAAVRVELLDQALERLLRDGTRMELAPTLELVRVLEPTPAEHAALARDYLALLDGSPPVAGYAQEVLDGLDEAGLVEPDLVTEACERVLLRPEKKIVRAQLSWLDKTAKRDRARAEQVVLAVSTAFDNQDAALQERALAVVARHLEAAGESVLPELRTAAERLSPGLSARAAELFGMPSEIVAEHHADMLPAVPEPRTVPGPLATVSEVAQEVAAVIAGDRDVAAFERALDGLVRHAHLDRAALAAALKPVTRREPGLEYDCRPADLYDVARAVREEELRHGHIRSRQNDRVFSLAGKLLAARLVDAIDAVESGARPFLLAVPTLATGALDANVLVERLATYEELGVTPGPADLAQALLRVTPTADALVLEAAGKLGSDAGKRTAEWIRTGGLPHQESTPSTWDPDDAQLRSAAWRPATPGTDFPLPEEVANLVGPYENRKSYVMDPPQAFWFAQLPQHRDEVAARDYGDSRYHDRGWTTALPFMAESGGPAGFAVHLALAVSTGTSRPADRASAVDAMLVLAARGQLDATLLGQQLAALVREGHVQANGLVAVLRTMAETGAHGLVWSIMEGALPGLLRDKPVRGAGELLAVAVECASRCGASGELAAVTEVAARKGSSLVMKNARALREVLQRASR